MKEELSHCRTELKKEKEMRENLERTIANIVKNFKRFYEEADTARMIITEKLREIQDKEKHLASKIAESELDQS
jgi:predicted  nucleic acid-binding Zn-ribbon protein